MTNQKNVTEFIANGIFTPRKRVELSKDLEIGTLVGLDANGKLVEATNKTGAVVRALGVITTGSVADMDSPRMFLGSNILKAGESQELYIAFVVQNVPKTEVDFTVAKYGEPVYLGVDGKMTTVKPTGTGTLVQVVGFVGDKTREEVVCSLFNTGEVLA